MGTRSTIGFRSGNEVRYIHVAHDGFAHGKTLEKLGHYNCLNLWEHIGYAEQQGVKVWLDHLYTDDVLPVLDWGTSPQKSPRTPVVATEKHWSKGYLETRGFELSGIIKVDTKLPGKMKVSPFSMLDLINMDGTAWLYDLDTGKVFFMGDPEAVGDLEHTNEFKDVWKREKSFVEF